MEGRLTGFSLNRDGSQNITVTITADFGSAYDELKDVPVEIEIKKAQKHRSMEANRYAWVLIDQIAAKLHMKKSEVFGEYEKETGNVLVERFKGMNPDDTPAVLVKNHGPFAWGTDAANAVHNAVVLEQVAKMAFISSTLHIPTLDVVKHVPSMNKHLIEKHYSRKHGPGAYYGQKKK